MPEVEVVVATRNRHAQLLRCLEALSRQTWHDFGVVVIDDASDPPVEASIPERLRSALSLRTLRMPERSGPGAARNKGVQSSTATYILFIDDDVRPAPQTIEEHMRRMKAEPAPFATIGPLAAPPDWKPQPWTLWEAKTLAVEYARMERGEYEAGWRQFHTGNACVRREDFLAAGGFDEHFTRAEDVEVALRMAQQGCKFAFLPDAVGWHYSERTLESWLNIPRQYGALHVDMDRLHPEVGWLETTLQEQTTRHPLLRIARTIFGRPVLRPIAIRTAVTLGRALLAARLRRQATYAISVAYDLEYNRALSEAVELRRGDRDTRNVPPSGDGSPARRPTVHLAISMTEADTRAAMVQAPRRDFIELARRTGARIHYRRARFVRRGLKGYIQSHHLGQAWSIAGRTAPGDVVYADQELMGLSLLAAIAVRRRRPSSVVVLAHLPSRRWKRVAFWLATRLGSPGCLIVHSVVQATIMRPLLPASWELRTHPYQVDTEYWAPSRTAAPQDELPLICAVGAEHRDYLALVQAADRLPVRVVIAAGSNWARKAASPGITPANVEYIGHVLPYHELRELYRKATAVIVPLQDVPNQSGITTMLEGMSMGLPVIATATRGQREAIRGPLVRADGTLDHAATAGRGPATIVPEAAETGDAHPNGLYVPPGDPAALRAALQLLLNDAPLRGALGAAARTDAERWFSIERFTERFAAALCEEQPAPEAAPERGKTYA